MSQSYIYDLDTVGNRMKSVTKLTDVTFAHDFTNVSFSFKAEGLDKDAFNKNIYQAYHNYFTKREHEIIAELCAGLTSNEIGDKLYISQHTVATHRKNILRKSACHNIEELSDFCEAHGILKTKKSNE
ncbi:response regulator transcription factor [Lutimonas sp.]|uniref:response regulator transcription factor n=1 Tax=Lutimonas sp. TaxID=1872403 RepID=UPI003D9BAFB9